VGKFNATNEQAWLEGTNIRTALRIAPVETRKAVCAMVKISSDYIDAKKRLYDDSDYIMVAEMIFNDFPTLKLEELRLVVDRIQTGYYGEIYERLKAPEFRKFLQMHETHRASILERQHEHVTRGAEDPTKIPEYDAEAAKLAWRLKNNPFLIEGKNDRE
jgi:hypothetical protein